MSNPSEEIQQQLRDLKCKPEKMRFVTVEPMTAEALEACTTTENECFFNSYVNVIYLRGDRYVLGYRCTDPVIDHAIIRKGDQYFDPTLQAHDPDFKPYQYAILTELGAFDVMKFTKSNKDFPPDVEFLRKQTKKYKNVFEFE